MHKASLVARYHYCLMCQEKPATDLHHIINRGRIPTHLQEFIPKEYMAMICNRCNCNLWTVGADTELGRKLLVKRNVNEYGLSRMRFSLMEFNQTLMDAGVSILTDFDEILDAIERNGNAE